MYILFYTIKAQSAPALIDIQLFIFYCPLQDWMKTALLLILYIQMRSS